MWPCGMNYEPTVRKALTVATLPRRREWPSPAFGATHPDCHSERSEESRSARTGARPLLQCEILRCAQNDSPVRLIPECNLVVTPRSAPFADRGFFPSITNPRSEKH